MRKPYAIANFEEIDQVTKYADEILKDFPQYSITRYVIYTLGSSQHRAFAVSP